MKSGMVPEKGNATKPHFDLQKALLSEGCPTMAAMSAVPSQGKHVEVISLTSNESQQTSVLQLQGMPIHELTYISQRSSPVIAIYTTAPAVGEKLPVEVKSEQETVTPVFFVENISKFEEPSVRSLVKDSLVSDANQDAELYQCEECGYSSHNKHYLKQHVDLVHTAQRPYKCPYCDYAGKRSHSLKEHLVVHSNEWPYQCCYCNATFRKKGHLTNHNKMHMSQRMLQCTLCKKQFLGQEEIQAHLRDFHESEVISLNEKCHNSAVVLSDFIDNECKSSKTEKHFFKCAFCDFVSADSESLTAHSSNHLLQPKLQIGVNSDNIAIQNTQEQVMIKCTECGFTTVDTELMRTHMWKHLDKPTSQKRSPTQEVSSANPSVKGGSSQSSPVIYKCADCKYNTDEAHTFISHMMSHREKQRVVLITSANKDNSLVTVDTENFTHDGVAGRFRCTICGYTCEQQRTIKAHVWKHSGHRDVDYPMFQNGPLSIYDDSNPENKEAGLGLPQKPSSSLITTLKPVTASSYHSYNSAQESDTMADRGSSISPALLKLLSRKSGTGVKLVRTNELHRSHQPTKSTIIKNLVFSGSPAKEAAIEESVHMVPKVKCSGIQDSSDDSQELANCSHSGQKTLVKLLQQKTDAAVAMFKPIRQSVISGPEKKMELDSDTFKRKLDVTGCSSNGGVVVAKKLYDSNTSVVEISAKKLQAEDSSDMDIVPHEESHLEENNISHANENLHKYLESSITERKEANLEEFSSSEEHSKTVDISVGAPLNNSVAEINDSISASVVTPNKENTSTNNEPAMTLLSLLKRPAANQHCEFIDDKFSSKIETSEPVAKADENLIHSTEENQLESKPKSGICSSLLAVIEQLRERSRSEGETEDVGSRLPPKRTSKKKAKRESAEDIPLDKMSNIEKLENGEATRYRCKLCHYANSSTSLIQQHMRLHKTKKPFECSFCDFIASSSESLQDHMIQHCKIRTYQCKLCPAAFNYKSQLRAHMRAHSDKEPFVCDTCDFETTSPIVFHNHIQLHSEKSYRCDTCEEYFITKQEFRLHKRNHNISCDDCDGVFADQEELKGHTKKCRKEFKCNHCDFMSSSFTSFRGHMKTHEESTPLKCEMCDFSALSSRSLKSHMKRHVNDQRIVQQLLEQYKCNLCGYVCHHLPSLKSHMWRHASDKNYSYEFTNEVINAAIDYDSRLDNVDSDDPDSGTDNSELECPKFDASRHDLCMVTFRCCQCGFETINKALLNIHMKVHMDIIQKTLDVYRETGSQHLIQVEVEGTSTGNSGHLVTMVTPSKENASNTKV